MIQTAIKNPYFVIVVVRTAEANLIGARAAIDKAKADVVAAESRVAVARANLVYAEQLLAYATIRAPWDGLVLARHFDAGAFVQSADGNSGATPLLKIAKVDSVRVTCALSTASIEFLDIGDRAVLTKIDALQGQEFEGKVTRFSAGMNEESRMMQVQVELPNPDGKLKPGFFGYLKIYFDGKTKQDQD